MYHQELKATSSFMRSMHEVCYEMTAQRHDIAFMTDKEATRFVNCINKVTRWMPDLKENLENTTYHHN